MNCRRCSTDRNVRHHHNDIFDGWFCAGCVDDLVNEDVEGIMRQIRTERESMACCPTFAARQTGHSGSSGGVPQ